MGRQAPRGGQRALEALATPLKHLDDELVNEVMRRFQLRTKKDAVDLALRRLVGPRLSVDCLIAAVALRHDGEVVHKDTDFDLIAGVTNLKVRALL